MEEIFKDIPNFKGYQISNLGRVKSLNYNNTKKSGILKPIINSYGYLKLELSKNGKKKTFKIHQLMAITFLGHKTNGCKTVVDHINSIKTDNRLENLQLISQRKNSSKDKKGTSKYTGVSWNKNALKWLSQIYIKGKIKRLGLFKTEKVAAAVYQYELSKIK